MYNVPNDQLIKLKAPNDLNIKMLAITTQISHRHQ